MVIQIYAPTSNAEEAEVERFYEDLQDILELTPKTEVLFIILDKQKTAYEMCVGDWSSDVCSSDLWSQSKNNTQL